ncbi:MAG: hypothetical protein M3R54_06285 [Chloroflexota bacterium]|nr:hypothetical protein [Chloroflexota bacterium]
MTREQGQLVRLLLGCIAWALGQLLTIGLSVPGSDLIVPAALAAGAYILTNDLGRARVSGGEGKYWRGRRIDRIDRIDRDPPRRDRWN